MQGVFRSSTSDSSGVADESGVFLVKRDPGAAAGLHSVCVFFRQRGGQFDQKRVLDPDDKLRLYGKFFFDCFLKILGTAQFPAHINKYDDDPAKMRLSVDWANNPDNELWVEIP
jgi:hypothetical protein